MLSAIFGREIIAGVDYDRPSGASSHLSPSHRGLSPPANDGRPSGAANHPAESVTGAHP